jgi:hypothetical protein
VAEYYIIPKNEYRYLASPYHKVEDGILYYWDSICDTWYTYTNPERYSFKGLEKYIDWEETYIYRKKVLVKKLIS